MAAGGAEAKKEKSAPIKAEVTQAFFVGDILHVSVQVFALTEVDPNMLLVKLVGLKLGAVAASDAKRGSEVLLTGADSLHSDSDKAAATPLEEGDSLLFRMSVPAAELNEYQLQISWGEDTQKAADRPVTQAAQGAGRPCPNAPVIASRSVPRQGIR